MVVEGVVLDHDGTRRVYASASGGVDSAETVGREVAGRLLGQGAADLIAASRRQTAPNPPHD